MKTDKRVIKNLLNNLKFV